MADIDKNIENSKTRFEIINQWISNCDTKSSILLAFYGVLLSLVFTSNLTENISITFSMESSIKNIGWLELKNFISLIALVSFLIFSLLCLFFIYNTLRARIDDEIYRQPELNNNSNIFFKKISTKQYSVFKESINSETKEDFLNDLNSQIFINSNIATLKFEAYNKSVLFGFLGVVSIGIYLLTI